MENLIRIHGWIMNKQNFLELKYGSYLLNIIPEYSYYAIDSQGRFYRSQEPQMIVLRIAIMSKSSDLYASVRPLYFTICSEDEFIDFMIGLTSEIAVETPNLEKAI